MANKDDEDWSDEDELEATGIETSVLLGIPDGDVESTSDCGDVAVSRVGGHPALLSPEPPISISQCMNCSFPMELLVQMWCPFENSPMDRVLYVWGCSRGPCRKKEGSIRAWRALKMNEKYAAKLAKQMARKTAARESDQESTGRSRNSATGVNPFSVQNVDNIRNPGLGAHMFAQHSGLGAHIFGTPQPSSETVPPQQAQHVEHPNADDPRDADTNDDYGASSYSSESSSVVDAVESITLADSPWLAVPAYPPVYLSTTAEYLPAAKRGKAGPVVQAQSADLDEIQSGGGAWASEAYENSLDVDPVFERFSKRVAHEGQQCVRYELGGIPLPFSFDKVFETLFPKPKETVITVTKADYKVSPPQKRTYTASSIPPCPACGSPRVFECQLMPNLINTLSPAWRDAAPNDRALTDEARKKQLEAELKGSASAVGQRGMDWGTCMVFSCEKDCNVDPADKMELKECWREEVVRIQWDE